jgi:hypothetical protein
LRGRIGYPGLHEVREAQREYNRQNDITPRTVESAITSLNESLYEADYVTVSKAADLDFTPDELRARVMALRAEDACGRRGPGLRGAPRRFATGSRRSKRRAPRLLRGPPRAARAPARRRAAPEASGGGRRSKSASRRCRSAGRSICSGRLTRVLYVGKAQSLRARALLLQQERRRRYQVPFWSRA